MTSVVPGFRLRPEHPDDAAQVRAVVLAAFPGPDEADLVDALRTDAAWVDGLSWVAVADDGEHAGSVVAHALCTRCHVDGAESLALAPVSVLPELQNRGLGAAVTRAVLDAAAAQGESSVIVLGHPDYYPRFGFTRASTHGVRVAFEVPDDALMALAFGDADVPAGTVRYAAPFGV
ncbi:GNAT family N-acetyltransferase [Prescottella subtropica]|uniref:GNAT family N-acetyltransferase n=1 Tax=Prescottella subtropica TaxID=2545757 RepID=UPI0014780B43|nr:N-acetyltransferase [Prescottella subtropica]